jgi:hypothetical protein
LLNCHTCHTAGLGARFQNDSVATWEVAKCLA